MPGGLLAARCGPTLRLICSIEPHQSRKQEFRALLKRFSTCDTHIFASRISTAWKWRSGCRKRCCELLGFEMSQFGLDYCGGSVWFLQCSWSSTTVFRSQRFRYLLAERSFIVLSFARQITSGHSGYDTTARRRVFQPRVMFRTGGSMVRRQRLCMISTLLPAHRLLLYLMDCHPSYRAMF